MQKMKELIRRIHEADEAYYQKDAPILSDREYDKLVLELKMLEQATGIRFANSPVGRIPADDKEGLQTVTHTKPMLSCRKTKSVEELVQFAAGQETVLSWKLDGLTLVLRYDKGRFVQAITRGRDGLVGEDVTHTVRHLRNIPLAVPCKDAFEVRGEGVVSWKDYEILSKLTDGSSHPRSIASGAVRSLTPDRGKLAHMDFVAFELIKETAPATKAAQLAFLQENNFAVVDHTLLSAFDNADEVRDEVFRFAPDTCRYPVDGLVLEYNDIAYGKSLGSTSHHEKRMVALKWKDKLYTTVFRGAELVTTRTGAVSIVGLFDEVRIDDTRVHRASLHNLSVFERFRFGIGDEIRVYKANMIIPQIAENITQSNTYTLPMHCPSCHAPLTVRYTTGGTKELYCPNEQCLARNAQRIARFCDKSAMNIPGLSAATIETMMGYGWIKSFSDLYHLAVHREEILTAPGFGADRFSKLFDAVENSRRCYMHQFLVGLGIPLLGPEAAKTLHQYYYGDINAFERALQESFRFSHIDGIHEALERRLHEWYSLPENQTLLRHMMTELTFIGTSRITASRDNPFFDAEVVITGTFAQFTRAELTELLTSFGARVSDRVSADTDYLLYGTMPGSKKVGAAMKHSTTMVSETKFGEMLAKTN